MKSFFIPAAKDSKQALEVYDKVKAFMYDVTKWKINDTKIFSINYTHNGKKYYAEVGKAHDLNGEIVIAIFDSDPCYLICTPNRGVIRDIPIFVGKPDTYSVEEFDV